MDYYNESMMIIFGGSLLLAACSVKVNQKGGAGEAPLPGAGTGPKVGQLAPDLTLPDETGQAVSLSAFRGKEAVLLAFYPKDFTGG